MNVPEVVNISINTPYPGTETWLTEQHRLQTRDSAVVVTMIGNFSALAALARPITLCFSSPVE